MTNETKRWQRTLRDLDREFRRVTEALEVILKIDRGIFSTSPVLNDLFVQMLVGIQKLTKAEHAQILLLRGSVLEIVHSTQQADKGERFEVSDCVCGLAVEEGRTIAEPDVRKKYPGRYKAVLGGGKGMLSEVVVPIRREAEERIIGVLNVEWPKRNGFHDVDIDIVEQFALQAGAAMHSARLREALALTLDLGQMIHSMSHRDAIRKTLEILADAFPMKVVIQFLLLSRDMQSLAIQASTEPATEGINVLVADSVSGVAVETKKAVRSDDVWKDFGERFKSTVADKGGPRIVSELAVPILDVRGVIGVLNVESPITGAFTDYDEYVLSLLANAGVWHRFRDSDRQRATAAMAAVGDVAGNLVHILTNSLLPVYGSCEELASLAAKDLSSTPLKQAIYGVLDSVYGFRDRVVDLRKRYERALAGNAPIRLNELLRHLAPTIVTRKDSKANDFIDVQYALDESIGELRLPPAIEDVIWNLLSNSNAAIPEEQRGFIRVSTKLHRGKYTGHAERLEITITDSGSGIPKKDQDEIYKLKFKPGAHGYGLWWIKSFVDRCDGAIELDSDAGRGATFTLRFPVTPEGEMVSLVDSKEDL
jgi:GAF domain-containing protein